MIIIIIYHSRQNKNVKIKFHLQFFIILLLVFCLQLAAAILAYTQQEFIRLYIDQSMYHIVQELYAINPAYTELFDNMQSEVSYIYAF